MSDQVLFADVELNVHQLNSVDGSMTLLPGQFVPLDGLPDYVQRAVRAGKVPGARVMDLSDAQLLDAQASLLAGGLVEDNDEPGEGDTPEVEEVEEVETEEPVDEEVVVEDEPVTEVVDEVENTVVTE